MYGASSHSQAATPGVEDNDFICTGDPVSVLVQVGCRRALVLAQVTKPSAPGQSAPFSLPSSQASSKSTTIEATVLKLLPVVGEAGVQAKAKEQLWQWGGRHVGSISVNGSLVATVNPSLMPRAVGSAASQVVTYQLLSADLDQLFVDAWCCPPSPISFLLSGACLLMPTCLTSLENMFCDVSAGQGDDTLPCERCQKPRCSQSLHQEGKDAQAHCRPHSEGPHQG
jgi:hypothetical protein